MLIHVEKIGHDLRDFFLDSGVAVEVESVHSSWIRIDSRIGLLYMTYLATVVARRGNLPLVSDSASSFVKAVEYGAKLEERYSERLEFELGAMLIKHFVPQNIDNIDLRRIIHVRQETENERGEFFLAISDLVRNVSEAQSVEELDDLLRVHQRSIQFKTENLKRRYSLLNIAVNPIQLVAAGCTGIGAIVTPGVPPVGIGLMVAGITFSGIGSFFQQRLNSVERKSEPYSYLLDLEKKLSPKLLGRLGLARPRIRRP